MGSTPAKRITSIKDIAQLAGCSIATVSKTLNNTGSISQELREKIFKICKEQNYMPNSGGRNLRRGKSEIVGLLFYPSCAAIFSNVYYAKIMEPLEATMDQRGYDLLLTGFDLADSPDTPPRFMRQGKVDGVILLGGFPRDIVTRLVSYGVPMLHLDSHRDKIKIDNITSDGYNASEQVVEHLVGLGHRRILFIAHNDEATNTDQREAGFLNAVEQHKLPKTLCTSMRDFADRHESYEAIQKRMQSSKPPTAIFCVNDTIALQTIEDLQADGYKVPEDVSVFGFNDDSDSIKSRPTISTVRVDKQNLGKMGAESILHRINNPDAPIQSIRLPVELIHRESVASPKA
ncbi:MULTISPECIES: LacI family DNA-binding transcriptional regulator [unclassified Lentimonas]|uniref:LacI family DNA-binding transcriptional regulator n=1 Tax=unclassified Lentimonas TaxID=2630993 RepID=UPI00132904B9|nr:MULTISPECIES: LacI family DNA-binding transcriptional regulator [unclassified Lentimonas]CAA6679321.1 Unannotated [Lentimonas sp. CC4]CAA6686358.1 Unannotated [Lentimonas sp. CC6]CAA7076132.1 Unannotated [Lentimonas sp. CC4]CAA7170875.1 Unannotated [Lentimonas sp. CC21]CAA7181183.1 Unannotated [Lentimonas sp. CC8]